MAAGDRQVVSVFAYKEDGTPLLHDSNGIRIIADLGHAIGLGLISGAVSDVRHGYFSSAGVNIVSVRATTYTEPSSAQQMRFVSSSANDTAAGTGTRTVLLTYYDGNMNGPLTETVTLNGITAVNTVATNIQFIEKIASVTVGSNGTNVGIISLQNTGGGTTFASIAASDGQTFYAHHYVQAGKKCFITRVCSGENGVSGGTFLRKALPLTANSFEEQITSQLRTITGQPQQIYDFDNLMVAGPARITMYAKPDAVTVGTVFGSIDFYEL
jgi:hypothetical protein